jgi:enoyl-CoA hydratase/carnithine racemase
VAATDTMLTYTLGQNAALVELRSPPDNAISFALLDELVRALRRAMDDADVRGIVITGNPERFSAGADLAIFQEIRCGDDAIHASQVFQEAFQAIEDSPKPVVAALAGHVLGGALELAMACHVRLATDTARFSMPEVNLGINPGAGGTQRLPRLVGLKMPWRCFWADGRSMSGRPPSGA